MSATVLARAAYRVRQFFRAVAAVLAPLTAAERAEAHAALPPGARPLFDAMPRNDQRHSLAVMRTLQGAGHSEPALLQAALLHDAAKAFAGLTLLHRVAIVLLKAFQPQVLAAWAALPQPARADLRYPFWAHANHPAAGADMAAAAGCTPLAVLLIRRHQERVALSVSPCGGFSRSDGDFQSLNAFPASPSKGFSRSNGDLQSLNAFPASPCGGFSPSGGDFQSLNERADDLLAALQAADDDN